MWPFEAKWREAVSGMLSELQERYHRFATTKRSCQKVMKDGAGKSQRTCGRNAGRLQKPVARGETVRGYCVLDGAGSLSGLQTGVSWTRHLRRTVLSDL